MGKLYLSTKSASKIRSRKLEGQQKQKKIKLLDIPFKLVLMKTLDWCPTVFN
jgi:hypothetical protein